MELCMEIGGHLGTEKELVDLRFGQVTRNRDFAFNLAERSVHVFDLRGDENSGEIVARVMLHGQTIRYSGLTFRVVDDPALTSAGLAGLDEVEWCVMPTSSMLLEQMY